MGGGDHVQIFIDALHELIGGLVAEAAVTGQQSGHGQGGGVLAGAGVQVSGQGSGAEVAVLLDRGLLMLLVDAQQLEVLGHGQLGQGAVGGGTEDEHAVHIAVLQGLNALGDARLRALHVLVGQTIGAQHRPAHGGGGGGGGAHHHALAGQICDAVDAAVSQHGDLQHAVIQVGQAVQLIRGLGRESILGMGGEVRGVGVHEADIGRVGAQQTGVLHAAVGDLGGDEQVVVHVGQGVSDADADGVPCTGGAADSDHQIGGLCQLHAGGGVAVIGLVPGVILLLAAGDERQGHDKCQQQCK